ncbi:MAG: GNAT family acetyltransferase [Sphingomonas sp.]
MSWRLRDAVAEDEARVVALWQACGLVAPYNDPAADFRFALAGPASTVLVNEDADGRIVGSAMVGHDGHRGWLYYLAAAPDLRGRGVGRAMVAAGEQWLGRHGVAKVQLMVRPTNTGVLSFYEALGYQETPRVIMAKWLRPD